MTFLSRSGSFTLGKFQFERHPKAFLDLREYDPIKYGPSTSDNALRSSSHRDLWYQHPAFAPFEHRLQLEISGSPALSRHASLRPAICNSARGTDKGAIGITPTARRPKDIEAEQDPKSDLPPDGGLLAWLQVLVAFFGVFNGFGYINSFGFFQEAYAETVGRSLSSISFVGSFQIFLLFFVGTISGRALDAGFFRSLLFVGCALQVGGIFATASATAYWQLFLAQGVMQGIGNGMIFTPIVWLVSTYFTKKRGLALGLASCGAPSGGIVFPLLARQLVAQIGYIWTVRVMGFVVLFTSTIILICARPRPVKRLKAPFLDLAAFREMPYLFYSVGIFFALWGLYWAPIYITIFAKNVLKASSESSLAVLMILNGTGVSGRLIPPAIADRTFGPLLTLTFCTLLSGTFLYIWVAVSSLSGLIAWCVFYAFWSNAVQTLFTATVGALTADFRKLGVRIGMVFTIISVASLTGPPLAGALVQLDNGGFLYAQAFGGTSMLVGFCAMAVASWFQLRERSDVYEAA